MTIDFQREIDVRGFKCPIPILRAKKTLQEMVTGQVLCIKATDTGSVRDFQAFAKQTGNTLLDFQSQEGTYTFFIQRK